ncbi:MAG: YdjY domain-containing protein [Thermoguttaceae bacterium]|jgi:hypothetical protein
MKRCGLAGKAVWAAGILAAVMWCGCQAGQEPSQPGPSGKKAAEAARKTAEEAEKTAEKAEEMAATAEKTARAAEKTAQAAEKAAEPGQEPQPPKELDLGAPLVDDVKALTPLHKTLPIWIDKQQKQVIFLAASCRADWPLEFFATLRDRSYESVVVTDVRPFLVHTGLLAVGAKPGKPVQFEPTYTPPSGTPVEIEVRWKDKEGKVQKAPAQQWIRNIRTKKAMDVTWVFAGSGLRTDEKGREHYLADGGDFITVLNLSTAMLDVPTASVRAMEGRSYEGFTEHMPPPGTPVTVVLKPKVEAP